jgi:hypothetical protein
MAPSEPDKRRLMLERGSVIGLFPEGPAGGFPKTVAIDRVSDGLHWILGSCAPLGRGEMLMVEYPVPKDARYIAHARIEACSDRTFGLRIDETWERAQQREFVRISTHGLLVRVVPAAAESPGPGEDATTETDDIASQIYPLLDISAGGIRFESDAEFGEGDPVVCHFELPGSECFVLPSRIVRTLHEPGRVRSKLEIAVEFEGLLEAQRSELLRWVYREQVKRHHDALRGAKQTRD